MKVFYILAMRRVASAVDDIKSWPRVPHDPIHVHFAEKCSILMSLSWYELE
ncbi:hypothetical protein [Melghiribacillus thermohalophilus]|uniref:hypothetical protein n=1 Tax=Melghiribacillus thermohalophilus TaxID=1324956 RepID=UPI00140551A7|nr:hypothetical protein [Melghiribacillus thermohalophilus]